MGKALTRGPPLTGAECTIQPANLSGNGRRCKGVRTPLLGRHRASVSTFGGHTSYRPASRGPWSRNAKNAGEDPMRFGSRLRSACVNPASRRKHPYETSKGRTSDDCHSRDLPIGIRQNKNRVGGNQGSAALLQMCQAWNMLVLVCCHRQAPAGSALALASLVQWPEPTGVVECGSGRAAKSLVLHGGPRAKCGVEFPTGEEHMWQRKRRSRGWQ
jgi:hypothetical protein